MKTHFLINASRVVGYLVEDVLPFKLILHNAIMLWKNGGLCKIAYSSREEEFTSFDSKRSVKPALASGMVVMGAITMLHTPWSYTSRRNYRLEI